MPLSEAICAAAVVAKLKAKKPDMSPAQEAEATAAWKDIIGEIFTHIKLNMVVTSTVNVTSVTGVMTGGGTSGPGSGTASSASIT